MSVTGVVERPTEPPKVDPRMRDRWVRARRQEGRRRLRLLVLLGALVVLVAAAVGVSQSPLLAVETVRVHGEHHETASQVEAVSGLRSHPAMLGLDTTAVARHITALPWVANARVSRQWPNTVTVALTERAAVAVVAQSGVGVNTLAAVVAGAPTVLVDGTGRVLATATGAVPGLPVIVTSTKPGLPGTWLSGTTAAARTPGEATPLDALLDLATDLPASLSASVVSLGLGANGTTIRGVVSVPDGTATFAGTGKSSTTATVQIPVDFGDSTGLPAKIVALQALMAQVDLSHVTQINVSDSQHPYLTGNPQPAIVSTTAGG